MRRLLLTALTVFLCCLMLSASAQEVYSSSEVQKITKEELKAVLDSSDIVIIDVRSDGGWRASDKKIKGAVREEPYYSDAWAQKYSKDKTLILYCS